MEDNKKSKKGLIISIIVALVVAGGAIAAVLILNRGNNPDSIALDAVTKTIKEPAHSISGKLELAATTVSATEENLAQTKIIFDLNGENNGMDSSSSATITVKTNGMSDFVFRFDEVLQSDGTIYVKPSDLTAFINSIASNYSQYLSSEPLAAIVTEVKSLATKISSNWWRISIPEVLKEFGVADAEFTEEYDCSVAAANELLSASGLESVANIYKNNQFLNVKKSDQKISSFTGDAYETTIDTSKLAKFWNEYATSDKVKKINECTKKGDTLNTVTPDELSAVSDSAFFLDIDKDHNLSGFYFNDSKGNYDVNADFRIEKGSEDLAIAAPSGAKPITDLTADITDLVQSIVSLFTTTKTVE